MFRLIAFLVFLTFPVAAHADYFLWQDPDSGLTMTFPDTWKVQNNQKPDEVLTVMGPSNDFAKPMCKVKVRSDKRYVVFPPEYGSDVQQVAVSQPFWEDYLGEYNDFHLARVHDGSGLGRWWASYALATYSRFDGTAYQQRRAIMFASLYNDKMYIVECAALNHSFEKYQNNFQSIIKSIDFKKAYHELVTGDYANFLKDADMYFWSQTGPEGTTAY